MKYGELNLGQIEAIVNKLGGMDGVQRFLADELMVKPMESQRHVWKTIKLGTGLKTSDDFRKAIKDCGMKIGNWANDILDKPELVVASEEMEVDLVKVTVAELGFKNGARCDQIYKRAKKFGLKLCPSEVGPQLRLQYKDQPNGEWILIGMDPIRLSGGDLGVFHVECHASELWLYSNYGNPDHFWCPGHRWVFVRPRKYQN